ncbi:hypothetical protein AB0J86_13550 [Micromonospora sp. NPDC049559]|uniref:hypothetical protein n=1 Tax=Micromonospora sp. NPDC049559 TaxID=3155923 RepID=UPI00344ADA00
MNALATLLTAAGLAAAGIVLVATGSWRAAIRILLDLLTAAGLIRLAGARDWPALAGAAAIVVLRQLLSATLLGPGAPRFRVPGRRHGGRVGEAESGTGKAARP